ncbi:aspartyl/asparaginyl beta-hydroxylase domain-containing protein [Sphingomonas sp.]|uniref:aspartyl/asparaginyl beta-hydroxylase domain-containing protein n=1 Tax=Sphingomonas sp. TaxID=28214 RepID=UPI0017D0F273|nr:aspartyl/asparaginyl beta-hydroxylase domain-containing protein [Sphingomonas sp.]MBA3511925.1 aspartyl/asparaginyl beta-hydroxylase domain-containing protein [Sphingomonas sp.]
MAKTAPTLEDMADQAAAAGDPSAAARLLEQAIGEKADNPRLWTKLSAMRRATGDTAGALEAIDRVLALNPLDFSGLLARAVLLDRAGDPRAGEAFSRAVAQAPDGDEIPEAMAAALAHARLKSEQHQSRTEERLLTAVPRGLGPAERRRIERFISNSARRTRHFHQEPTHFHYPGLPELDFHDAEGFPALAKLEGSIGAIRAEFDALIAAEAAEMVPYVQYSEQVPLRQWKALNFSRDWTAIHLLQNGRRVEANARHCPRTLEALSALPQPHVPGACPNAMFSLLAPHTRIPPHTGVANTRLVCHLALIVPPACGFRVGDTTVQWKEGEAFVFDDTIEHEAWNDSDQLRVVLIADLWPPALGEAEREAVAAVIAAAGVSFGGGM